MRKYIVPASPQARPRYSAASWARARSPTSQSHSIYRILAPASDNARANGGRWRPEGDSHRRSRPVPAPSACCDPICYTATALSWRRRRAVCARVPAAATYRSVEVAVTDPVLPRWGPSW
ncbi:hypothetical protein GCM10010211_43140 [Streptomyces albospinus]|uniref:Uncharacterized protein n=1 Tax=Streptomyces albospinus TaxID=285515 RepID=A0ABQ2V9J6_9ACTN|nr:hypothetical protein GCM10010211_43140 [Streptomyces albospinus]